MSVVIALLMGVAVLLTASPFLWPRDDNAGDPLLQRRSTAVGVAVGTACATVRGWARAHLVAAGLPQVSVMTLVASSVLLAIVVSAITLALLPVVALAVAVGIATLAVPTFFVRKRANSSRRATRVLWPDVVDHLISAVRSGLSLPDSLAVLAQTGPAATREAFASFGTRYHSTGDFGHCIDELKDYLSDPVADRILETVRMSREVGGSELTAVLRSLAAYLRQDAAIRSEVEARQSWVMNSARLGVAAPWVVLALLSTRPEAAIAYNSTAGAVVVIGGLGLSVVAYQIMVGLGRIPPERRWFR